MHHYHPEMKRIGVDHRRWLDVGYHDDDDGDIIINKFEIFLIIHNSSGTRHFNTPATREITATDQDEFLYYLPWLQSNSFRLQKTAFETGIAYLAGSFNPRSSSYPSRIPFSEWMAGWTSVSADKNAN